MLVVDGSQLTHDPWHTPFLSMIQNDYFYTLLSEITQQSQSFHVVDTLYIWLGFGSRVLLSVLSAFANDWYKSPILVWFSLNLLTPKYPLPSLVLLPGNIQHWHWSGSSQFSSGFGLVTLWLVTCDNSVIGQVRVVDGVNFHQGRIVRIHFILINIKQCEW